MLLRPPLVACLLIALVAGGPAYAAPGDLRIRRPFVPPPSTTQDAGLRGALAVPAPASAPAPSTTPPVLALPPPGAALTGLSAAGLSAPPLIAPLRDGGDPAPMCRATCAKTRIICASNNDLGCDAPWSQCVATCAEQAATDASRKS